MNEQQRKRAQEVLRNSTEIEAAGKALALLQELVDAPEPEPFAVIHLDGSFVHVEFKQPIAGTGKFEVYAAPSVPDGWRDVLEAVLREMPARKDNNGNAPGHGHRIPGIWDSDNGPLAGKPCAWCLTWNKAKKLLAATPTPAEPPADVARDAERLNWLDKQNTPHGLGWEVIQMPAGNVHIHAAFGEKAEFKSIREAIDAARERQEREILGGGHD